LLIDAANASRSAVGSTILTTDEQLGLLAADWSLHLADLGRLEHRDLVAASRASVGRQFSRLGENIAMITALRADAVVLHVHEGWMSSVAHRQNVLDS
jgi:uncharacterized protein YkwD